MMSSLKTRLLVGLGLPAIATLAGVPVLDRVSFTLFGLPAVLNWFFLWYVLTSGCLAACWFLHDRTAPDTSADTSDAGTH